MSDQMYCPFCRGTGLIKTGCCGSRICEKCNGTGDESVRLQLESQRATSRGTKLLATVPRDELRRLIGDAITRQKIALGLYDSNAGE